MEEILEKAEQMEVNETRVVYFSRGKSGAIAVVFQT